MLTIQSDIAKYHCLHTEVAVALQTPGVFFENLCNFDIENCLLLFPIWQIRFSNLPRFNRSFLPVEIGDFLQKAPFENLQNE